MDKRTGKKKKKDTVKHDTTVDSAIPEHKLPVIVPKKKNVPNN